MDSNAKTLLVVDDDEVILTIAELGLKRAGFNVVRCPSGMACLESLMYYTPDMILLDVEMPIMSGIQTLEVIRSNEEFKDIPVMFLTGSTDTGTVVAAKRLGAVGYVVKPFIPQELTDKVNAILKL
jgi:putative two-component system response regulator